ncbi:MAG TPA: hypothetical protein VKV17_14120 [Bryobacteraceae bacterium]|nr:hypothetical protein [Bryobacteraceae bacterium]
MCYRNRLAVEGEDLVVHRFPSGSKGLASPSDLPENRPRERRSWWVELKNALLGTQDQSVPAVCIPPGATLKIHNLNEPLQRKYKLHSEETVAFEELTGAVNTYRDAVHFSNDIQLRIQDLPEGLQVTVIDLGGAEAEPPVTTREAELLFRDRF